MTGQLRNELDRRAIISVLIDSYSHRASNHFKDAVDIAHDVRVPETQHTVAPRLQIAGTGLIFRSILVVLTAVELDDEADA